MKYITLFIIASFLVFLSCGKKQENMVSSESKTSTFYFIRHAEKDRSDAANKNPHLLEIGKQRAEKWRDVLKNIHFDAVYSTNYNRTKETAQPTALKNHLEVTLYDTNTIDIPLFIKENEGKNVLVVGHSNTTPEFVNAILKKDKYNHIEDSNNSNLYIVTIFEDSISDTLLVID